ncbi:VOC family protein [Kitasatospora sp. NPDC056138]|uniref:VOC family protein n=1 Tax=Kitasatospora sp. NPDC056138 TaxID=3345724 RepID=UPI0035E37FA0
MLTEAPIHAVIPAADLARATAFYRDALGLKPTVESEEEVRFESGGTRFSVYRTPNGGKAAHTLASWTVADLDAEMADLRSRGVVFEEYDMPGLKTVDGVAAAEGLRCAWFRDSEGNILCLAEEGAP